MEYGSDKSFSIIPDSGYYISDVNVDDKSVGAKAEYTFENVSDNHRIHAKFEAIQYTIRATANEHLNIKPSGEVKAKQGSGIAFTITADKGYRIGNVIVDGKSIGAVTLYEFINVTSDHTISAVTDGIEGMKGDVNGDGKIRANDAIMALRISTGQLIPTREQEYAADMNNDGRVRSNDAILILRKSVELE